MASSSTKHLALPKPKENNASKKSISLEDGDNNSEICDICRQWEELVACHTVHLKFFLTKEIIIDLSIIL